MKCDAKWFVAFYSDAGETFYHGWEVVAPLVVNETRIKNPDER